MIQVEMRGRLEPVKIKQDFPSTLNKFNVAAAERMQFILLEKEDGNPIGLYIPNILTFEEVDDEGWVA